MTSQPAPAPARRRLSTLWPCVRGLALLDDEQDVNQMLAVGETATAAATQISARTKSASFEFYAVVAAWCCAMGRREHAQILIVALAENSHLHVRHAMQEQNVEHAARAYTAAILVQHAAAAMVRAGAGETVEAAHLLSSEKLSELVVKDRHGEEAGLLSRALAAAPVMTAQNAALFADCTKDDDFTEQIVDFESSLRVAQQALDTNETGLWPIVREYILVELTRIAEAPGAGVIGKDTLACPEKLQRVEDFLAACANALASTPAFDLDFGARAVQQVRDAFAHHYAPQEETRAEAKPQPESAAKAAVRDDREDRMMALLEEYAAGEMDVKELAEKLALLA